MTRIRQTRQVGDGDTKTAHNAGVAGGWLKTSLVHVKSTGLYPIDRPFSLPRHGQ